MRIAYVDTSCLVAIALGEPGWEDQASRLESFDQLVSANLLEAEFRAVLRREELDGDELLDVVRWLHPNRSLEPELREVLAEGYVRGADLWHLACALYFRGLAGPLAFLTADERQGEAARRVGLSDEG